MKAIALGVIAVVALAGCAGGPGAPVLRKDAGDGQGPQIPNCSNISPKDRTGDFMRGSYLTTWGSAMREGATAGLSEAVGGGQLGRQLEDQMLPSSETFCKAVPGRASKAYRVGKQVLQELGYKIHYGNQRSGILETDYVYQSRLPLHQWQDRFALTFDQADGNTTIVRVFRDVYISRALIITPPNT
jgi:hypothetical protein